MNLRMKGLLLFLFIPLVLYLFLTQPVNPLVALLAGVAIMFLHRMAAGPSLAKTLDRRCAWCGAGGAPGCAFKLNAGGADRALMFCNEKHRQGAARFFAFARRFGRELKSAIYAPLAFYLAMELIAA